MNTLRAGGFICFLHYFLQRAWTIDWYIVVTIICGMNEKNVFYSFPCNSHSLVHINAD